MDAEQLYLDAQNGLVNTLHDYDTAFTLYDHADEQIEYAIEAINTAIDYLYQCDWQLLDDERRAVLADAEERLHGAQSHYSIIVERIRTHEQAHPCPARSPRPRS